MSKRQVAFIALSISVLILQSCKSDRSGYNLGEIVFSPAHAAKFEIRAAENDNTVIRIKDPWQGAEGVEKLIYVSFDGSEAPKGFEGQTVHAPIRRAVCMSSSYVAMFDALDMGDRICGVSGGGFISSPAVRRGLDSGLVKDVGYESGLDFELIASMNPDIVLMYGVADDNGAVARKLEELGIPYGYIGDYMENSALGKAEWMVAIGEMCGAREQAEALFEKIAFRYDSVRSLAGGTANRPKVMLNAPYRDVWFLPAPDSYMVSLLEDAGAECLAAEGAKNMSLPVSGEKAYTLLLQADVWLNPGAARSLDELAAENSRFMDTPPVKNGRVFNNNRRTTEAGGSDFWESGTVRPDVVLSDLIRILHPELSDSTDTYYYMRLE